MAINSMSISAIILAGGLGTRIRQELNDKPKALAEVVGRPIIEWLLIQLLSMGVADVIISIGYRGQQIVNRAGFYFAGAKIRYVYDGNELLGTGGAVLNAIKFVHTQNVLVLNGDTFCDFSLDQFLTTLEGCDGVIGTSLNKNAGAFLFKTSCLRQVITTKPPISLEELIDKAKLNCERLDTDYYDIGESTDSLNNATNTLRGRLNELWQAYMKKILSEG